VVEILDRSGRSRGSYIQGRSGFQIQKLALPIQKIKFVATKSVAGTLTTWAFQVRAGGRVESAGSSKFSYSQNKFRFQMASIEDLRAGEIELSLNNFLTKASGDPWIYQNRSFRSQSAKYKIRLQSKSDVKKFYPNIATGNFSLTRPSARSNNEIYFARSLRVVASANGSIDQDAARKIRGLLDADFAFRGDRAAFFDARNKSAADFQKWIDSLLASGGRLYIMKNGRLFPISKNFVRNRSQVLRFIGRNASYIFAKKVEILDAKNSL